MSSQKITDQLNIVLVETYSLYLKTQSYHWNVAGANFYSLHKLFEEQYKELAEAIDEIAERIRALGTKVEANFSYFDQNKSVSDSNSSSSAEVMLKELIQSHEIVINQLKELSDIASDDNDKASEDIAIQRIQSHEKQKWMLSSSL